MRRVLAVAACVSVCVTGAPAAQQPPSSSPSAQEPFRAGVDVIRLDVSVLDEERRPVQGLTMADFTVIEDGKPQRIVSVAEIDAVAADPAGNAWMRYVERDVVANSLATQIGDGRAVALVVDDLNIPWESIDIRQAARAYARYIIDSLGPSDVAAVVFPTIPGNTVDFTQDRSRLLAGIDRFPNERPERLEYVTGTSFGGDIQQTSVALAQHRCLQGQPLIPALRTVTAQLATVLNQRKTIFLMSTGAPVQFSPGSHPCQAVQYYEMLETFRTAQRANVNIHTIDPAGHMGLQSWLTETRLIDGRMRPGRDMFAARQSANRLQDSLRLFAEQTGGRAVVGAIDTEGEIDQIFAESASYYLIGYETSNGRPDGKFRRVQVKVNRDDLEVRTRTGYWAPDDESAVASRQRGLPTSNELNLSGLISAPRLALHAALHPVGPAEGVPAGEVEVASILTVTLPALRLPVDETVTLVRTILDPDRRAGPPVQETTTVSLAPQGGDATVYDLYSHFSLRPGRYEVRLNATSSTADASSSVFAAIDVPDIVKRPLTLLGPVLSERVDEAAPSQLAEWLPVRPTTTRTFTRNARLRIFLRLFQGRSVPPTAVEIGLQVLDAMAAAVHTESRAVAATEFDDLRSATHDTVLPLEDFAPGMYVLSITGRREGAAAVRRDVVFRVE